MDNMLNGNYALTASYSISSSYTFTQPYVEPKTEDKVAKFFESLGYKVSWDYSRRLGKEWYEIYQDGKLVAQIDMGVPLADLIMDLCQFHLGKEGVSESDYQVCGHGPLFDEMLKKVYETANTERSSETSSGTNSEGAA